MLVPILAGLGALCLSNPPARKHSGRGKTRRNPRDGVWFRWPGIGWKIVTTQRGKTFESPKTWATKQDAIQARRMSLRERPDMKMRIKRVATNPGRKTRGRGKTRRNPTFYKTFKRSATGWDSFASARKITYDVGLTEEQARAQCKDFNDSRSSAQIRKGTKLEYTAQ